MIIENIADAFAHILHAKTLLLMAVGVAGGLIAGAIPGFTIAMAVVLTLPFTFSMPPEQGLATMISVFVGGLSGGLMAGVLTGIPGTPSSVATTFDGFPMARGGRPGLALGLGVWSSFTGGMISAVLLVTLAPQLARVGLEFQPWDYFMLVMFALTITASTATTGTRPSGSMKSTGASNTSTRSNTSSWWKPRSLNCSSSSSSSRGYAYAHAGRGGARTRPQPLLQRSYCHSH